eukprot:TRINITY_DN18753_c0_g1_i1.p1 TRINITY_DN18753_c0_g1~~TRINITY_DN18753_c0_g1_i1.p1  ORF type:complete len:579 (+),score=118.94 TRINITY_DN18753_c0_g1_i1:233-1969(+)
MATSPNRMKVQRSDSTLVAYETGTSQEEAREVLNTHNNSVSLATAALLWAGDPPRFDGVGPTSLWISWNVPPWPKAVIEGYRILQQIGGHGRYEEVVRLTSRTSVKITGLSSGVMYKFKIHAKSNKEHIAGSAIQITTPVQHSIESFLELGKWLMLDASLHAEYQVVAPMGVAIRHQASCTSKKRFKGPTFRDRVRVNCEESVMEEKSGILMLKVSDSRYADGYIPESAPANDLAYRNQCGTLALMELAGWLPVQVQVMAGLREDGATRWLGPLKVGLDSNVRVATLDELQEEECQFWVHGRPDRRFSLESFDGRFLRMWLWRLSARPLNDTFVSLENNTAAAFGHMPIEDCVEGFRTEDSSFHVSDFEMKGNCLSVEPQLPQSEGAEAPVSDGCIVLSNEPSEKLVFRFEVAPQQLGSPGSRQLLDVVKVHRSSEWDDQDMKFVKKTALVRSECTGTYRSKLPAHATAIDFEAIGLMLEALELQQTGKQKLETLLEVRQEILRRASEAGMHRLGADELLPILVMALIWSPLISPSRDVALMGEAVDSIDDDGEATYIHSCFSAAVEYIITELDPHML